MSSQIRYRESRGSHCQWRVQTTEYTEWHRPLAGVHSIMMEKLTQTGECGGLQAHPLSLHLPSHTKLRGQIH
jgi:hypothetical protein